MSIDWKEDEIDIGEPLTENQIDFIMSIMKLQIELETKFLFGSQLHKTKFTVEDHQKFKDSIEIQSKERITWFTNKFDKHGTK